MKKSKQKVCVVCWEENGKIKTKVYKFRKSAEKFGLKMMLEHDTAVDICVYQGGELVSNERYN